MFANLDPERGTCQGELPHGDIQGRRDEDHGRPLGLGGMTHLPRNSCIHCPYSQLQDRKRLRISQTPMGTRISFSVEDIPWDQGTKEQSPCKSMSKSNTFIPKPVWSSPRWPKGRRAPSRRVAFSGDTRPHLRAPQGGPRTRVSRLSPTSISLLPLCLTLLHLVFIRRMRNEK